MYSLFSFGFLVMLSSEDLVARIECRLTWLRSAHESNVSTNPRHASELEVGILQLESLLAKYSNEASSAQTKNVVSDLARLGISILS